MFHMLTGQPPFTGSMLDVLSAHVKQAPVAPSTVVAGIPSWVDTLVVALLAKKPEGRPGAYRVVQQLEAGTGDSIRAPELHELDREGNIVVPAGPPTVAIALGLGLLVLLLLALAVVGLMVVSVVVAVLSLS